MKTSLHREKYGWLVYTAMFITEWSWHPFGFWKVWSVLEEYDDIFAKCLPEKDTEKKP